MIYLVEEDFNIRQMESISLKSNGYAVKEFKDAKHFFSECHKDFPDLLIINGSLADENFIKELRFLKEEKKAKKLSAIVTLNEAQDNPVKETDFIPDDYMTIPFGIMEFLSRVKAVLREKEHKDEMVYMAGNVWMDEENHMVFAGDDPCELTFKEYKLLRYLLANKGSELSREAIMKNVWGTDLKSNSRTVDMHIKTLRQKLGESGAVIKSVRNVGYKIEE